MSINNISTFYNGLEYDAYTPQTDYIEYLIETNGGLEGPTGPRGPIGPTGPPGPPGSSGGTTWIDTYVIPAPPAITYGNVSRQSTRVYIPWTNYAQINVGIIGYLPLANEFRSTIIDSEDNEYQIRVPVLDPYNLQPVQTPGGGATGANGLSGVVLYKTPAPAGVTGGIQQVQFPGESTLRRSYVYYDVALDQHVNSIESYYLNFYNGSNPASLDFSGYLPAFGPSAVRNPTIAITGSTGATFNYTAPQYADSMDPSSTLTIDNYEISYKTTGSTIRYPAPIEQIIGIFNTGNTNTYYNAIDLYPDCPYTYAISAVNSEDLSGDPVTSPSATTNSLNASSLGTLGFPERYYGYPAGSDKTIYRIGSTTPITTLVNNNADWSSDILAPIQNIDTRGNLSSSTTNVMDLSTTLNTIVGPTVTFKGFGSVIPTASIANSLTINPVSISDTYLSSPVYFRGFFQNTITRVTIGGSTFVQSGDPYVFTVSDSSAGSSTTFTYYYDGIYTSGPSGTISYRLGATAFARVSGVYVLGGSGNSVVTSSTLTNIGKYFYVSPYMTITSTNDPTLCPATSPTLANISVGYSGGQFAPTIQVNNFNIPMNSFDSIYDTSISMSAIATNVLSSTLLTTTTGSIPTIIDGLSYTLINETLPTAIPNIGAGVDSPVIGFRVYSAIVPSGGTSGTTYFTYNNDGTTAYRTIPYNQAWDISLSTGTYDTTAEILVHKGAFSTPGMGGYIDYQPYLYSNNVYNTVNYSTINATGYRYATFVWKINTSLTSNTYTTMNIILNNVKSTPAIVYNTFNKTASIGGKDLQVFYRFENTSNLIPTQVPEPPTDFTTIWANANSAVGTDGKQFTTGTYFGTQPPSPPDYNTVCWGIKGKIDTTNNGMNFSVYVPPFKVSTAGTEYLYCRVGLPMDTIISYESVSAIIV